MVIAESFARIFYRNAFNIGLPILESGEAAHRLEEGGRISVDLTTGDIHEHNREIRLTAKPIPDFMREIIQVGGLVDYIKQQKG